MRVVEIGSLSASRLSSRPASCHLVLNRQLTQLKSLHRLGTLTLEHRQIIVCQAEDLHNRQYNIIMSELCETTIYTIEACQIREGVVGEVGERV
jgi:hypothetical protein